MTLNFPKEHRGQRRATATVWVWPLLLSTACSVAFDYPNDSAENTFAACHDGADNDFDGRVDCDDAEECIGHCAEDGSAADAAKRCRDSVDNDADGFIDAADPSCWTLDAPEVTRCAAIGSSVGERFDLMPDITVLSAAPVGPAAVNRWYAFGTREPLLEPASSGVPRGRRTRPDEALALTNGGAGLRAFVSGNWEGFELAFSVSLMPGATVHVGLFPEDAAHEEDAPREDAAILAVDVAGDLNGRKAVVRQGGRQVSATSPFPEVCGKDYCDGGFDRFSLTFDGTGFRANFGGESLPALAASGLAERSPRMRLVIWAGQAGILNEPIAFVDDVDLHFLDTMPCGFAAPQMPRGDRCSLPASGNPTGAIVSAAGAGPYCALVSRDIEGYLEAWKSTDGSTWSRANKPDSSVPVPGDLPLGAKLSLGGAAIAWDSAREQWRAAVVAVEDVSAMQPDQPLVKSLRLSESSDCASWSEPLSYALLPEDTESLSYIVESNGDAKVLFTRPPTETVGRTLWQFVITESSGAEQPAIVTSFPGDLAVGDRAVVTRVGTDRLLTYKLAAASGKTAVGLAVSDASMTEWRKTARFPLLERSDVVAFDDSDILGGNVVWGKDGGFLLYGARGTRGAQSAVQPISAAGTALLLPSGSRAPEPKSRAGEPADDSPGDLVDLRTADGWIRAQASTLSSTIAPQQAYVNISREQISYAGFASIGVDQSWLYHSLNEQLDGDVELSFELRLRPGYVIVGDQNCHAWIGLGSGPPLPDARPDGVYAELLVGTCSVNAPSLLASAQVDGRVLTSLGEGCTGRAVADWDEWQRVTLTRQSGRSRVTVDRGSLCGLQTETVEVPYTGSLPPLDTLLVGPLYSKDAGAGDTGCTTGELDVRGLRVRSLGDPASCATPLCAAGSAAVCIDPTQNPEHCGGCGLRCPANQRCQAGACTCDIDTPGNCGACGADPCGDGSCVFGQCSRDVGESCSAPTLIPAEGGVATFFLNDRVSSPDHDPCHGPGSPGLVEQWYRDAAFVWTPSRSGNATLTAGSGDPVHGVLVVLSVTEDASCATSDRCRSGTSLGTGAVLKLDVVAGRPYFILVASQGQDSTIGPTVLKVEPPP